MKSSKRKTKKEKENNSSNVSNSQISSESFSNDFWGGEAEKTISSSQNNTSSQTEQQRINNEIEALSCIYIDAIEKIRYESNGEHELIVNLKPNHFNSTFFDPICWIKLKIKYNRGYPVIPPGVDIIEKYNISESEKDSINTGIDNIANVRSDQNCEMINDILDFVKKFLDEKSKSYSPFKRKENPIEEISGFKSSRKLSSDKYDEQKSLRKNIKRLNYNKGNDLLGHNYTYNSSKIDYENVDENFEGLDEKNFVSQGKSRMLSDFQIIDKIGEGGGGSVYKVKNNFDGMFYAIKKVNFF